MKFGLVTEKLYERSPGKIFSFSESVFPPKMRKSKLVIYNLSKLDKIRYKKYVEQYKGYG